MKYMQSPISPARITRSPCAEGRLSGLAERAGVRGTDGGMEGMDGPNLEVRAGL
jgi:hypothetical protein